MLYLVKRNCTGNTDFLGSCTSKADLYVFYGERTVQFLWYTRHCLISSKFFVNIPLFYFYSFKHKMQSRSPKFSVFIFHSLMVCSCADNLIAYGFNFFVSKIGICAIQTFWGFLSCSSGLQACISGPALANDCIKDKSGVFQWTVCTKEWNYRTASGKWHKYKMRDLKIMELGKA